MNYKMIFYSLGNILKLLGVLFLLPFIVSIIYQDNCYLYFLLIGIAIVALGFLLTIKKPKKTTIYSKEGMFLVGMAWIVISLLGCLPFVISKQIPNFIDAFFETVSGFTTTGASILTNVEGLSKSMLFWRSFTHWIGGMGVLVFILALMPKSEGQNIYILKAESTGPQVGKLVSKVKSSAQISYLIYIVLTIIEIIMLLIGKMPIFDAIVNSLATAGTGGFAITSSGIAMYNDYCQVVIGIFMMIFGINFNIFYLLLIGHFKQIVKSEEFVAYIAIIAGSVLVITLNIYFTMYNSFAVALKDAFFQVSSIITTTGFATADFNTWPMLSKTILIMLMFIGGCAGSTAGGLKVSRILILVKDSKREVLKIIHPNSVTNVHMDGVSLDNKIVYGVTRYFSIFMLLFAMCFIVVSFDANSDFESTITAVAACINNIGPGLGKVGPTGSFAFFSPLSKATLIFAMLVGRLEIYPILILFSPKTWLKK